MRLYAFRHIGQEWIGTADELTCGIGREAATDDGDAKGGKRGLIEKIWSKTMR